MSQKQDMLLEQNTSHKHENHDENNIKGLQNIPDTKNVPNTKKTSLIWLRNPKLEVF